MTVERPITIYRLLRTIRDRSAKEVADELLVTSSYIGAIEKQIRTPSVRFDRAFAKLMDVPEELIRSFIISENDTFATALWRLTQKMYQLGCLE